ncbi:hypothetical protein [Pontivivens ytuae]|uniref:Glycerophosphoryl diester phosphodiesterase membrane domain-containing protein n=1 Tax=Pontivivens ytuae TaxID=2789856 RepID=A0A7S9LT71_9RHOB|nr:hypothetical protein [Pontivivens ytuae]QPH54285.1 hypothetical protein I0K15_00455 [Pontivivens ytuae]
MTVGDLVRGTVRLVVDHFLLLFTIAFVGTLATTAVQYMLGAAVGEEMSVLVIVIGLFLSAVINGLLCLSAWDAREGAAPDPMEDLNTAFRMAFPLLGVTLAVVLMIAFGFVLLIIPGLFAMTVFSVSVPALLLERPISMMDAMIRSTELTRGYRWQAFGGLIVIAALGLFLMIALAPAASATGAVIMYSVVVNTVLLLLSTAYLVELYGQLRDAPRITAD